MAEETGYQAIQNTKPQTLMYGLVDSPVAILAWIREKLETWTDDYPWTDDEAITCAMLYYYPGKPAVRIYKEAKPMRTQLFATRIHVPVAVSLFPKEIYKMPKAWIEKYANLIYYKRHAKGGHFAATEQPQALSEDIICFAEKLMASRGWREKASL